MHGKNGIAVPLGFSILAILAILAESQSVQPALAVVGLLPVA